MFKVVLELITDWHGPCNHAIAESNGHWSTLMHPQNISQSKSYSSDFWTLRLFSPVQISSWCFQVPLELSMVVSDTTWAVSGASERTWSQGGTLWVQWDLTYMIVIVWIRWDLCAGLQKTSSAAETCVLLCMRVGAVYLQQGFSGYKNHNAYHLSYSSLLKLHDSLQHYKPLIVCVSPYIYIWSVWMLKAYEHNCGSTSQSRLGELMDSRGGYSGGKIRVFPLQFTVARDVCGGHVEIQGKQRWTE